VNWFDRGERGRNEIDGASKRTLPAGAAFSANFDDHSDLATATKILKIS
jgi:hypothetical protein